MTRRGDSEEMGERDRGSGGREEVLECVRVRTARQSMTSRKRVVAVERLHVHLALIKSKS